MKRLTLFIVLACLGQAMQAQETQETQAEEMPEKAFFEYWYDVTHNKHQHYQSTNAYDRIETADSSVTIEIIHEILPYRGDKIKYFLFYK